MAPGFFEELLPLITDEFMGDPDTRPLVPVFVEEACRRRKGFIPMCTAMIVELSKDDNPSVLSNTMRATAVLVRKGLIAICSDDGDVADNEYSAVCGFPEDEGGEGPPAPMDLPRFAAGVCRVAHLYVIQNCGNPMDSDVVAQWKKFWEDKGAPMAASQ